VVVLEANLDDLSPQLYDGVMRALLAAGALDVWITPVQMKKNRPGCLLSALAPPELRDRLAGVLFAETTTLGLRYSTWNRSCLEREWVEAETGFGSVRLKVARRNGRIVTATPEFEDCRARAEQRGVPIRQVQAAAQAAAWRWLAEQK
jgi:hypothetical protein